MANNKGAWLSWEFWRSRTPDRAFQSFLASNHKRLDEKKGWDNKKDGNCVPIPHVFPSIDKQLFITAIAVPFLYF